LRPPKRRLKQHSRFLQQLDSQQLSAQQLSAQQSSGQPHDASQQLSLQQLSWQHEASQQFALRPPKRRLKQQPRSLQQLDAQQLSSQQLSPQQSSGHPHDFSQQHEASQQSHPQPLPSILSIRPAAELWPARQALTNSAPNTFRFIAPRLLCVG